MTYFYRVYFHSFNPCRELKWEIKSRMYGANEYVEAEKRFNELHKQIAWMKDVETVIYKHYPNAIHNIDEIVKRG